jgi:hypothetical protein
MFNFTFEKTSEEIVTAATVKASVIHSKIAERMLRIKKLREEYEITDAVLIDIQNQMRAKEKANERTSYTSNARSNTGKEVTVGAGIIDSLTTEQDLIADERSQIERLELIIRNLRPVSTYTDNGTEYVVKPKLNYEELKYLGF